MVLLWILLGITSAIALIISYYWIKFGAPRLVLITGLSGVFMFLFAVVWAIISISKGELMAASLGILTLGIPAILLIASGWKLLESKNTE
ncbi:MAG: hypothetical protein JXR31_00615 [Prolixibacteraceae bacterium]|nr:hypothetical protein [Prolixibacteraceae bacterium]MBN2772717.1 hypothetical protein [Prolixibacteraceae bacterium]